MNYYFNGLPDIYSRLLRDFLIECDVQCIHNFSLHEEFDDTVSLFSTVIKELEENTQNSSKLNSPDTVIFSLFPITNKFLKDNKVISFKRDLRNFFVDACILQKVNSVYDHKSFLEKLIQQNKSIRNEFFENSSDVAVITYDLNKIIENSNHLILDLNQFVNANERVDQIHEFKRLLDFLEIKISDEDLVIKMANALNRNKFQMLNPISLYSSNLIPSKFEKELKKLQVLKLNDDLGFGQTWVEKLSNAFLNKSHSFYDLYWKRNNKKANSWTYGIKIVDNLIHNYEFNSVLDAGCGSADVVRYFLKKGYDVKGIELSGNVLKERANDLLKKGIVQQGSLTELPFPDNHFDVVFSSEVLEHIPEADIPKVISELTRVTKSLLFLTISLRPSSNFNRYHITLKPREWWENIFLKCGNSKDNHFIEKLQKKDKSLDLNGVLLEGPTKSHIEEMEWFIEKEEYSLQGEIEPWYFIFKVNE